jgi:hypothetical protein
MLKEVERRDTGTVTKRGLTVRSSRRTHGKVIPAKAEADPLVFLELPVRSKTVILRAYPDAARALRRAGLR